VGINLSEFDKYDVVSRDEIRVILKFKTTAFLTRWEAQKNFPAPLKNLKGERGMKFYNSQEVKSWLTSQK